jgi:hypothetical protein
MIKITAFVLAIGLVVVLANDHNKKGNHAQASQGSGGGNHTEAEHGHGHGGGRPVGRNFDGRKVDVVNRDHKFWQPFHCDHLFKAQFRASFFDFFSFVVSLLLV